MRINDDFTQPILVSASRQPWIASPAAGVERRMLFRVGEEKARASSIVRYAPGSSFAPHVHTGGEEFLVLDGTFQDENGDYPAGTYVRNPPGTSHAPAAKDGTTIFVRLWQFGADDDVQMVRRPGEGRRLEPRPGGKTAILLFEDPNEEVRIETWWAGAEVCVQNSTGLEFLVVDGEVSIDENLMVSMDWGRLPPGHDLAAIVGRTGAKLWIRFGPPLHPDVCPF